MSLLVQSVVKLRKSALFGSGNGRPLAAGESFALDYRAVLVATLMDKNAQNLSLWSTLIRR